jgi:hypothetical protein
MDDLNGLDWSASSKSNNAAPKETGNYYPTLRPTPPPQTSGRNAPLSAQGSGAPKPSPFAPPKASTPDSFANLVSFGSSKQNTLTLQEQQEKLQAERRKKEEEKRKQYETQFGSSQFWDGLGNRGKNQSATPPITLQNAAPASKPLPSNFARAASPAMNGIAATNGGDDDLFVAFNADTKVDKSSYYPPPPESTSSRNTPGFGASKVGDLRQPQAWEQPIGSLGGVDFGDDDDPFGLSQMKSSSSAPAPIPPAEDDDDFLGDLGKPVDEVRRRSPAVKEVASEPTSEPESDDPWDKAVAELVDMGFSAEQSRRALTESGSGLDIQVAVGWILNDAHRQAKQKQQGQDPSRRNGSASTGERRQMPREGAARESSPAWMREEERDRSQSRREDNRSPGGEADLAKVAAAMGSNLFKTANSLWKTSQKKVQKAVSEFQQESDPSQPKWMREAAEREQAERRAGSEKRGRRAEVAPKVTDEALMLEGESRPPPRKAKAAEPRFPPSSSNSSRDQSPAFPKAPPPTERSTPIPRWQQATPSDPRSRVSKQAIEEQSAQAYISPARRKKATPVPMQQELEPDLLFSSSSPSTHKQPQFSRTTPKSTPTPSKPSTPIPTRPKAPPRQIPPLSPSALAVSNQHRLAGATHFKRGDYAAAHASYTSSLSSLPSSHPITIILLCNRALTSLKTGVPKSAVSDADTALELIGPSRGEGESIDLGASEPGGPKSMREFWGKALMRKAEALEQMEKWREAGEVWKLCVEGGVGAGTAIQGRTRCECALAPKPAPQPVSRTVMPKPKPKPAARSAMQDLGGQDSEAVERLRKANKDAEKADDEKFALADKVDERIGRWRDGKKDNLRALIGSLDLVMWEGSAWKKVGMHELVQNNKVKIHYMKAIGKCHPDKVCCVLLPCV